MQAKSLNILLIDDDKDELPLFDSALQKSEMLYTLSYLNNAVQRVFETLDQNIPDIIFLDINMPLKNGIYFLEELKRHDKYKNIPVIIYSTSTNEQEVKLTFEKGAHRFVVKPYSEQNLVTSFKRLFSVDWTLPQPPPEFSNYVINLAYA